ncbi:unnamed protein product [Linum trigynum]|uniref:Uncharacterized protein n=1 Tax=Linum trigynum TaxID=586398 RepID=A0AAV2FVF0_9ROSI
MFFFISDGLSADEKPPRCSSSRSSSSPPPPFMFFFISDGFSVDEKPPRCSSSRSSSSPPSPSCYSSSPVSRPSTKSNPPGRSKAIPLSASNSMVSGRHRFLQRRGPPSSFAEERDELLFFQEGIWEMLELKRYFPPPTFFSFPIHNYYHN